MPFVDLALVPEAASSLLLPRLLGHQRAARLLMLGEICSASNALALGLVSELAAPEDLLTAAEALAQRLLAKPASALRASKALMKPDHAPVLAHMKTEAAHFSAQLASPEFHANAAAFFANKSKAS